MIDLTAGDRALLRRWRVAIVVVALPPVLSAGILLLAGLFPVRLDQRTFQTQSRLEGLGLPRGDDFLVLTRDNEIDSARIPAFAIPHWSFPRGATRWLTLKEASHGVWSGGFLGVDGAGRFHRPVVTDTGWRWSPVPAPGWLDEAIARAALVYDSVETRERFEERLPALRGAAHTFVARQEKPGLVPLTPPFNALTPTRWWRLSAMLGAVAGTVMFVLLRAGAQGAQLLIAMGVAAVASLGLIIGAAYVVDEVQPGSGYGVATVGLWLIGVGAVCLTPGPLAPRLRTGIGKAAWVIAGAALLYGSVVTLRLDFDGDTYTTYLPAARYYYWLGHHDPRDPGVAALVQGAVYPPAHPVLLALPLWLMDQPRESSYALGGDTAVAILLYRWVVVGLNLCFLGGLWVYFTTLPGGSPPAGLAAVLGALLLVPTLRGQHWSAETLLIPLFGAAVVAILHGRRWHQPLLAGLGLFLAGFLISVKLEGALYLMLLALPAALSVRATWPWRVEAATWVALLAGLVPALVWRLTGPAPNPSFELIPLPAALGRLPALAANAFKLLLRSELWLAVLVITPLATAARMARRAPLREYLLPAGITAFCGASIGAYAFSTLGPLSHMETSFARIMLAPSLAALLYGVETLVAYRNPPAWAQNGERR